MLKEVQVGYLEQARLSVVNGRGNAISGVSVSVDRSLTLQNVLRGVFWAIFLCGLLALVPIVHSAFDLLVVLNAHECGHAIASNFGGRFSVPTPFGMTGHFSSNRSFYVTAIFAAIFIAAIWYGRRNQIGALFTLGVVCLGMQTLVSFILSDRAFEQLCLWAGQGGELIFGAALMVSFFYSLPSRFRWQTNRQLVFAIGAALLFLSSAKWISAGLDPQKIPWGSLWQGFGGDGDLDRLRNEFSWTVGQIQFSYLFTAAVCWIVVLGHFVVAVSARKGPRAA